MAMKMGGKPAKYPSYITNPLPADMTGMASDAVALSTRIKAGYNIGNTLEVHLDSRAYFLNHAARQAVANGMLPFYWDNGVMGNNGWALFNRQTSTVYEQQSLDALVRGGNGLGL